VLIVPGPFFINVRVTNDSVISEHVAKTKSYFSQVGTNSHHSSFNVLRRNRICLECIFFMM
jgi:hypothetical protein